MFVVVEGVDGVGKTMGIKILKEQLESRGLKVGVVKSLLPDTVLGKAIREWMGDKDNDDELQITLLFLAAILEANKKVKQLFADGMDVVISDRWILSTAVYAPAIDSNRWEMIGNMITFIAAELVPMTAMVILESEPDIAADRLALRNEKQDVFQGEEKQAVYKKRYDEYKRTLSEDGLEIHVIPNNHYIDHLTKNISHLADTLTNHDTSMVIK